MQKLFITGATGNVGSETINKLSKSFSSNYEIIAGVRNIHKAKKQIKNKNIKYKKFDFKDKNLIRKSLKGIDKLFLIRPPAISKVKKYIYPVINVAKKSKVNHIVFLSLQGVENNPVVPHYKIEKYIKKKDIPYTFLRPSFFMQNLSTVHQKEIKENNEIFIPAGDGKTSFVDVRDVAEVAALVLATSEHKYKSYEITGTKAYNYYQVADILTEILNRKIVYKDPSIIRFFMKKIREGETIKKTIVMIGIYTLAKLGKADHTTDTVKKLLGREPMAFSNFVRDYKECWL